MFRSATTPLDLVAAEFQPPPKGITANAGAR